MRGFFFAYLSAMYKPLDLSTIRQVPFPESQFYNTETAKKQICLHHTASGKGIDGDALSWASNPQRIATCVIVGYDGRINQLYSSKVWGHHLGVEAYIFRNYGLSHGSNLELNKGCIGIEIDAWGPVVLYEGKYRNYVGGSVPIEEITVLDEPYRKIPESPFFDTIKVSGKQANCYHSYSDEQIYSVAQLLQLWTSGYGIPIAYREAIWEVSREALSGEPGIWTHGSFRPDKADIFPQPEIIEMLKSI